MSTARELIKGSLRLIGAIAPGETPSADELSDALSALNDLVDSWSTQSLVIYAKTEEEFTLTSGTSQYTMGSGGDFNTTRPQKIVAAQLKEVGSSTNVYFPVHIATVDEWVKIDVRNTQSTIPSLIYPEGTYPLETINLWPTPGAANKLVLFSWKALSTFSSADTSVSLPPGFQRALKYNLAIELAPEYGKSVPIEVAAIAGESFANIKRMNKKPMFLNSDPALMSRNPSFNWYTGE